MNDSNGLTPRVSKNPPTDVSTDAVGQRLTA